MSGRPSQELEPWAISEDLVQSPTHKPAATKSVDFGGLLAERALRLHEDLSGGNGGKSKHTLRTPCSFSSVLLRTLEARRGRPGMFLRSICYSRSGIC
nr:hypothetical protein CFP56_67030 [Quercus suber]